MQGWKSLLYNTGKYTQHKTFNLHCNSSSDRKMLVVNLIITPSLLSLQPPMLALGRHLDVASWIQPRPSSDPIRQEDRMVIATNERNRYLTASRSDGQCRLQASICTAIPSPLHLQIITNSSLSLLLPSHSFLSSQYCCGLLNFKWSKLVLQPFQFPGLLGHSALQTANLTIKLFDLCLPCRK